MASDLINIRLGNVCTKIGSGSTPKGGASVYSPEYGIALIRSQNVTNNGFLRNGLAYVDEATAANLDNVKVEVDDVLLNITGDSVARVCQVDRSILPARVNQHVSIIRTNPEKLDSQFLCYYLKNPIMQNEMLSLASAGATRNALTKGMIEDFNIKAPSDVRDQQAIASILGSLDDKIELNRATCETLEEMARAIFKSWFVDFDPVRAKMAGEKPASICVRLGLTREILDLFPNRLVDSELGEIPDEWEIKQVDYFLELAYGKSLPKNIRSEGVIPVYGSGGSSGYHNKALVEGPGIVVGRKGSIGTLYWVDGPFFPIDTVFYVTLRKRVPLYWIYEILRSLDIPSMGADSAVPGVNRNVIYAQKVCKPSDLLLNSYWKVVEAFITARYKTMHEMSTVESVRDTLLPKLISGEIEVPVKDGDA